MTFNIFAKIQYIEYLILYLKKKGTLRHASRRGSSIQIYNSAAVSKKRFHLNDSVSVRNLVIFEDCYTIIAYLCLEREINW